MFVLCSCYLDTSTDMCISKIVMFAIMSSKYAITTVITFINISVREDIKICLVKIRSNRAQVFVFFEGFFIATQVSPQHVPFYALHLCCTGSGKYD